MTDISDLRFPIIAFNKNAIVIFKKKESLTRCGTHALKNKMYNNLIIIDSDCNFFEVKNAKKDSYHGPLWGFRLLHTRTVIVELTFKDSFYKTSIEEVKERIRKAIKRNSDFWTSAGEVDELIDLLNEANSFEDILKLPYLS